MSSFHDNKTRYISKVSLRVVDIDKSIEFYNKVLGFEVINKEEESVLLGISGLPLIRLKKAKTRKHLRAAGLYHIAFLVPTRKDLANWLYYHLENGTEIEGASHHNVSEAIYLSDIDGNGIEIYADTPADTWNWESGRVEMTTKRLDLENLFQEVTIPTNKLALGTIIGHLHLSVVDLNKSKAFYNLLGFKTVLEMSSAAFLSDKEYHHHLGMNIWNSFNGSLHNDDQADIASFTIKYPSKDELSKVLDALKEAGFSYQESKQSFRLRDVNNIEVYLEY
ncbi:MAG: VOC family protein [Bacilli bacterium]|nr:VOC family protein [Bacilli bacterium]